MGNLEDAILLAAENHKGQSDRAGRPYILHPLRVMFKMQTDEERIVAVLHDVIEDTPVTLEELRMRGYSKRVLDAVDHLSRREDETYDAFIDRIARNPLAVRVKLADLEDNMEVRTLVKQNDDDRKRLARYKAAREKLQTLSK